MVCIIDYGLGNVGSLLNMFKRIGKEAVISSNYKTIEAASHLLLPGVGSFDSGIFNLLDRNLILILKEIVIDRRTPILGICLGAQLMLKKSEEGVQDGLGWINGKVVRFKYNSGVKIPHMGWNNLTDITDNKFFADISDNSARFYFVHSYHFLLDNPVEIIAKCNYDYNFAAAFRKDNIIGVQFHPEKSHKFGMQLLKNFLDIS